MELYFSTIVRGASIEKGGELVWLDWETKRIRNRVPIFPENPAFDDPNPRGNSRGGRGVAILADGRAAVASYHSLYLFSPDLKEKTQVTNNLLAGIHEVTRTARGTLLVASTALDAALELDPSTGNALAQYWPREMPEIQNALGVAPLEINKQIDNRLLYLEEKHIRHSSHVHLNIATEWNGEVYGLLHAYGAVANLSRGQIMFRDAGLKGAHNLILREDGTAIINNTYEQSVQLYDLKTGHLVKDIHLTDFAAVKKLVTPLQKAKYTLRGALNRLGLKYVSNPLPYFVRGLDVANGQAYVGLSPSTILQIDLASGNLVDWFTYSHDLASCVHGVAVKVS